MRDEQLMCDEQLANHWAWRGRSEFTAKPGRQDARGKQRNDEKPFLPLRLRLAVNPLGLGEVDIYGIVRLTMGGRECPTDVMEVPDGVPVLIGQIPLEYLDYVVDPRGQRLVGNPAHGGEHTFELY